MAKFSKEELRKKLARDKSKKNKPKPSSIKKTKKNNLSSSLNENLGSDLKKLGLISLVVVILLIVSIYIKSQTTFFDQIADYFYQLIN